MGSLADFSLPDGSVNPAALVQVCGLIQCLQNDDRAAAQSLLQRVGTAQIVEYVRDDTTLPPDYVGIVDGTDLVLVIMGTMTAAQWTSQIVGATATPYPEDTNCAVGAFWGSIAGPAGAYLVRSAVPPITRVKIAGHSYGGAIAQLLGFALTQSGFPTGSVQVMTLGAPVPLTSGYRGTQPATFHRIQFVDDIVPQLPPVGFTGRLSLGSIRDAIFSTGPQWTYYGVGWYLYPAGGLQPNRTLRPTIGSAVASVAAGNLGIHDISYYSQAAVATYAAQAGDPQVDAWLPTVAAQAAIPNPQRPAAPIPQSSWVNVPGANQVYFPGGPGVITAANLGTIQSVVMAASRVARQPTANIHDSTRGFTMPTYSGFSRCTFVVNNGRYGRFMSTVIQGPTSLLDAYAKARQLALTMSYCLGNSLSSNTPPAVLESYPKGLGTPVIEFVRVTDALNPRVSQLFRLGGPSFAGSFGGKAADFQATALSMRLPGASIQTLPAPAGATTFQHFGNFLFCGQPDDCVQSGSYVPGVVMLTGRTMDDSLANLLNKLSNTADQWGFMGLDYTQPLNVCGPFTIYNVSYWQTTVPTHGYAAGDKVHITAADALGFNGTYKVGVIDANTIYLLKGPRVTLAPPTSASVRRVQLASGVRFRQFYRYQLPPGGWVSPFGIKISKKNPGRQFLGVSFRKRPRKVK